VGWVLAALICGAALPSAGADPFLIPGVRSRRGNMGIGNMGTDGTDPIPWAAVFHSENRIPMTCDLYSGPQKEPDCSYARMPLIPLSTRPEHPAPQASS